MMDVNVIRMGPDDGPYFFVVLGDGDGPSRVVARCEAEAVAVKLAAVLGEHVPDADLSDLMERASWKAQFSA